MENKKITFVTIIVLLIIFLPLGVVSTVLHVQRQNDHSDENLNHEFRFNGKLYFYQGDTLLGIYLCENPNGYCDYAIASQNDPSSLAEYLTDKTTKLENIEENRYVFLMDAPITTIKDAEILLYDLQTQKTVGIYKEVKNYGVGLENHYYMLKNSDYLWGAVQFYEGIRLAIPFQYDYIGIANTKESKKPISVNLFATLHGKTWKIVDQDHTTLLDNINQDLVSYTDSYLILKDNNGMKIVDYHYNPILNGSYKYLRFYDSYLVVLENNTNNFYLYDLVNKKMISNMFVIENIEDVRLETSNKNIRIYVKDEFIQNVAIG